MNIISVNSPIWGNSEHNSITLTVEFEGIGAVPFSATSDDVESYGRDLYTRAVAGEFGPVAEFVPITVTKDQLIAELTNKCRQAILSGFTSSALGSPMHYPYGPTDQTNLSGSVLASILPDTLTDWVTPFWCEDSNGVWAFRMHTATQIQQVGRDAKDAVIAAQTKLLQDIVSLG